MISVTETYDRAEQETQWARIASDVFAKRKDRELFSLLHHWRRTVNEFTRN
jgi:hypothetical protein